MCFPGFNHWGITKGLLDGVEVITMSNSNTAADMSSVWRTSIFSSLESVWANFLAFFTSLPQIFADLMGRTSCRPLIVDSPDSRYQSRKQFRHYLGQGV